MANGPLSRPKLPGIPGINEFKGHTFHTSRWDYDYTGGDSSGGLTRLADKRVGIIGTGATAIQCVPHLGDARRPSLRVPAHAVVGRCPQQPGDRPGVGQIARRRLAAAADGQLQHPRQRRRPGSRISSRTAGPTSSATSPGIAAKQASRKLGRRLTPVEKAELMELADFQKMESIRARVESVVEDPATAEKLKPWYRQFCKRPCFHDEYLETYNRPNVTLVDTDGKGVDATDRERGRRRRPSVRGRLPDLRHRLRGRHDVHAPSRLRHHRTRRRVALRQVGERFAHVPRPADATRSRTASSSASRRRPSPSACRTR